MLNAVCRGPASVARSLRLSSRLCSRIPTTRSSFQSNTPSKTAFLPRTFVTSARCKQHAAQAIRQDPEELEGEIEEEIAQSPPPSSQQIDEAVQHGPVTKFADLSTRGLVSQTVVDTLTQNMKLETMTQVQSLTINETIKGTDV